MTPLQMDRKWSSAYERVKYKFQHIRRIRVIMMNLSSDDTSLDTLAIEECIEDLLPLIEADANTACWQDILQCEKEIRKNLLRRRYGT